MSNSNAFGYCASDGWCRTPNIGLSPERIQALCREAEERIAAEKKAKEEAKARKTAAKGKLPDKGNGDDYHQQYQAGGFLIQRPWFYGVLLM